LPVSLESFPADRQSAHRQISTSLASSTSS
jgi:hypothetical protein